MFVAKFSRVSAKSSIKGNKHGVKPMIGEVMCGISKGSFIDGTMFEQADLVEGKLYLCDNTTEKYDGEDRVRVQVICAVSPLEFMQMRKELGAPVDLAKEASQAKKNEIEEDEDIFGDDDVTAEKTEDVEEEADITA